MIQQFIKFCVVGGSGVFVDFGVTYLCKEWLRLNKYLANSLGFLCASTSNYVLNRIWTFHNETPTLPGNTSVSSVSRPSGLWSTTSRSICCMNAGS